jgi:hypothetical protein
MCGCGESTAIAKSHQKRFGQVKGEPVRFLPGHSNRKSPVDYLAEDRGHRTPCWIWQKAIGKTGYGNTYVDGTTRNAHRVYYERVQGPIPDGKQLDHLCRVRACVNPDHLEPVTNAENSHRGMKRRLSWADVQAIRNASGFNDEIAAAFGVSATYVGQIRLGRGRVAA